MVRRVFLLTILSYLTALAAGATACRGSNSSLITTEHPFFTSTPGSSQAITQTPGTGGGILGVTAVPPIKISASNTTFDKSRIMAQLGTIEIEFDNNDANVTHNLAVYRSSSDTTTPLGATPITTGPDRQTLTITLDQGQYYFQCEVHPQRMHGTLIVH
jgi:plastocyanin